MFAPNHGLPPQLYRALTDGYYTREVDEYFDSLPQDVREKYRDKHFSTTTLIRAPRQVELWRRHRDGISIDPMTRFASMFGHGIHELLRRYPEGRQVELRSAIILGGYMVHGAVDTYHPEDGEVSDWKVTKAYGVARGVKAEHVAQLNVNAFILRKNGKATGKLVLHYFVRDHDKKKVTEGGTYPLSEFVSQEVEGWDDARCLRYIYGRVQEHSRARALPDTGLPLCTPEERWEKPATFAVMKPGNKTASYVSTSAADVAEWITRKTGEMSDAHDARETKRINALKQPEKAARKPFDPPGFQIEERPGDPCVRCGYCDSAPVCRQRIQLMEEYQRNQET